MTSNIINDIAIGTDGKIWIAHGYNEFMSPSGGQGIVVLDENGIINNTEDHASALHNIYVFPNPTIDNMIIEIQDLSFSLNIELLDLNGKVLLTEKSNSNKTILQTSQISPGIYFLKLSNKEFTVVKKVIKK